MNFLKDIFLGAIKGILSLGIALIMLLIFFSIIGALFSPDIEEEVVVSDNSLLYIDNLTLIGDRDTKADELNFDFEIPLPLPIIDNSQTEKISLLTFKNIINKAAEDDKIKGIYLNVENVGISFNKAEKVRDILEEFKKSKPIYSFADLQTKGAYFISSVSDFVAISPPGFISVSGFGISEFFFKNMLDELGIKINLFRVGEYKGAAETYVRTDFSDENEEQYLNLLNYRMTNYIDRISSSRGIEKDKLISIIDDFETELPKDALNNKLIDSLIYEDEMSNYLKNKVDSSYKKISLLKYRKTLKTNKYNKNKIAVLYAIGGILPGSGDDGIYSESIIKEIKKIKKNKNIKSVVLYVNSGGGSAFASDLIARELKLLNDEKPLIAYMSDVCASGGYYISMPADTLIASSGSIVGSIGVFGLFPEMSGLLNDKLKISTDQIRTNKNIGENVLGMIGRGVLTHLSGRGGWYRRGDMTLDWDVWGGENPIAIESPVDMILSFNVNLFKKYIKVTDEYHLFCAWDDICMQFLENDIYNVTLPNLQAFHNQNFKGNKIPKKSANSAKNGNTKHFGRFDHFEYWKSRWGWERDDVRETFPLEKYEGTLIGKFYSHDYKRGPMRIFDETTR